MRLCHNQTVKLFLITRLIICSFIISNNPTNITCVSQNYSLLFLNFEHFCFRLFSMFARKTTNWINFVFYNIFWTPCTVYIKSLLPAPIFTCLFKSTHWCIPKLFCDSSTRLKKCGVKREWCSVAKSKNLLLIRIIWSAIDWKIPWHSRRFN